MTAMLATAENREEFVTTSISFLRQYDFDGLDLDFEYPGNNESPAEDKHRFTLLIQVARYTPIKGGGVNSILFSVIKITQSYQIFSSEA